MKIPPFKLIAKPLTEEAERAAGYKWAPEEIGTRHQLGGEPAWLQDDQTPRCPACQQPMTFYGQLDSIGDDFDLADCGMIYVFVCFDDFEASAIVQAN